METEAPEEEGAVDGEETQGEVAGAGRTEKRRRHHFSRVRERDSEREGAALGLRKKTAGGGGIFREEKGAVERVLG